MITFVSIYSSFTNYSIQLRTYLLIVISQFRTQAEFQVSHLIENETANKFYSIKILSTGLSFFRDISNNYEIRRSFLTNQ